MSYALHKSQLMLAALALAFAVGALAACNSTETPRATQHDVLDSRPDSTPQATFASADEAVKALLLACVSKDHDDMKAIFGAASKDLVTGDPVEDESDFNAFATAMAERATLEEKGPDIAILHVGKNDWAFPIPIIQTKDGKWHFDTVVGETEIKARRIGANELDAITLCRTYVDAQREYASVDRNGDEVLEYAQRLKSTADKHDGLYWPIVDGESTSPFGPLVANAASEGYPPISGSHTTPTAYHGYYFHILKEQGSNAPGGLYNYVINGHMIAGFALVAYPAEYGKSGVMTFIVSHQGKVYQKDLGQNTSTSESKITSYDPDKSWTLVRQDPGMR